MTFALAIAGALLPALLFATMLFATMLFATMLIATMLMAIIALALASRRRSEALRSAGAELAVIHANAPVALLVVDDQFRVQKVNALAASFAGKLQSQLVGHPTGDALGCVNRLDDPRGCGHGPSCGMCPIRSATLDSLRTGARHDGIEMWLPDSRAVLVHTAPIQFGRTRKVLISIQDITARKKIQEDLAAAHRRTTGILESISDGFLFFDRDGRCAYVNPAAAQLLRKGPEELLGRNLSDLLPAAENITPRIEICYPEPLNAWFEIRCCPSPDGLSLFFTDSTERKRAQEQLQETVRALESALAEKTVLLKEVHHRVKNNLAVIASLLNMRAGASEDPAVRQALEDSRQRVHSIALIHEHLYGSDHLDRIDFAEYARHLVDQLNAAFLHDRARVSLAFRGDPVELAINRAVPCALILNELLTNAFKHAFPDDRKERERPGAISVDFREAGSGWLELSVEDDGIGLPAGWGQSQTLGWQIIPVLARQLDGSVAVEPSNGARFVLRFPLHPKDAARESAG